MDKQEPSEKRLPYKFPRPLTARHLRLVIPRVCATCTYFIENKCTLKEGINTDELRQKDQWLTTCDCYKVHDHYINLKRDASSTEA